MSNGTTEELLELQVTCVSAQSSCLFLFNASCLHLWALLVECQPASDLCAACCLQGEGEKKAEAVATVVAAVDLARVRLPVQEEGGWTEEEKAVDLKQQATAPAEAAVSTEQRRVQLTQVRGPHSAAVR